MRLKGTSNSSEFAFGFVALLTNLGVSGCNPVTSSNVETFRPQNLPIDDCLPVHLLCDLPIANALILLTYRQIVTKPKARGEAPGSLLSARTRSARAFTAPVASSAVAPYASTPGSSGTSAIHRPSSSGSISTVKMILRVVLVFILVSRLGWVGLAA